MACSAFDLKTPPLTIKYQTEFNLNPNQKIFPVDTISEANKGVATGEGIKG